MPNENQEKNAHRVLLAFDFGKKRIGTAIGQTVTKQARPLTTIAAKEGHPDWQAIDRIIKKWRPDALIVGIPLNMDGTLQAISSDAKQFAQALHHRFQLPIYEVDERLTTKDARERLFNEGGYKALQGGQVDCVAAQLMLQNWFDENLT